MVQQDQIQEVYDILREKEVHIDKQTWNRRYRGFMEKIKTGSLFEVAEVFRDLYRLKNQKTLSFGERRMLDTARTLIVKSFRSPKAPPRAKSSARSKNCFPPSQTGWPNNRTAAGLRGAVVLFGTKARVGARLADW